MSVGEMFSCDNSGNRTPAHPLMSNPVAESGVTLDAGKSVPGIETVVGGQMYAITCTGDIGGHWLFSTTGAVATASYIEWAACRGDTIIIKVPQGKTTLYYLLQDEKGEAYMRTLDPEN